MKLSTSPLWSYIHLGHSITPLCGLTRQAQISGHRGTKTLILLEARILLQKAGVDYSQSAVQTVLD